MRIIRRLGRLAAAWIFVYAGSDTLRNPEGRAQTVSGFLATLRRTVTILPGDAAAVRVNAGVQVCAGLLLASDRSARLGAGLLAASLIPVTLAAHPFWAIEDPALRSMQRTHFNKNLSMFGGLVLMATEPRGR
jgi:putative oxidoreductase